VGAGGAVCVHCRPPGAATPAPAVFDQLLALRHGRWERVETIPESARRQASGLIAAHLQWHLEHKLRTLPLVERSDGAPRPGASANTTEELRAADQVAGAAGTG
jgi:DNA repair protein RecO (recombination protein O)